MGYFHYIQTRYAIEKKLKRNKYKINHFLWKKNFHESFYYK